MPHLSFGFGGRACARQMDLSWLSRENGGLENLHTSVRFQREPFRAASSRDVVLSRVLYCTVPAALAVVPKRRRECVARTGRRRHPVPVLYMRTTDTREIRCAVVGFRCSASLFHGAPGHTQHTKPCRRCRCRRRRVQYRRTALPCLRNKPFTPNVLQVNPAHPLPLSPVPCPPQA